MRIPFCALSLVVVVGMGCMQVASTPTNRAPASARAMNEAKDDDVDANLAKLGADDRKLAEEQRFCAVANSSRLGSMGAPVKIMINDEPVFLCCKGCAKKAQDKPEETLAKVKELKAKNAAEAKQ